MRTVRWYFQRLTEYLLLTPTPISYPVGTRMVFDVDTHGEDCYHLDREPYILQELTSFSSPYRDSARRGNSTNPKSKAEDIRDDSEGEGSQK